MSQQLLKISDNFAKTSEHWRKCLKIFQWTLSTSETIWKTTVFACSNLLGHNVIIQCLFGTFHGSELTFIITWSMPRSIAPLPPGWDASPSQGCPPAVYMSPVPIYTPGWGETKWSKVPCLRKQRNRQGLNLGSPDQWDREINILHCALLSQISVSNEKENKASVACF